MQQILSVWSALEMRKRVIVVVATVAMFAAVLGLSRMASQPSLSLLYAGLESGPAGEVVNALEARSAIYEVRGGAIFVESARRDELRMTLASEGLPTSSSKGYELLDGLSGFGTTSQMFDAAYWRAKEGELARTIVSSPLVQNARVHIANPNPQGFRQRGVPTASVTVTTTTGSLSAQQAKALKFLIASAVTGLAPGDVSIIDGRGGLIMSGDDIATGGADSTDRAQELKGNVERLLEARVGYGNAVVEVNVDTATERESILEHSFDPDSRVAISTETEESTNAASDSRNGGVSVASNLPSGDVAGGEGSSSSNNSETRERVNYEVSETTREILRTPGAIKRISVAVLVDGLRSTDAEGYEVWTPRPEEELSALRELVASAVGLDEARGDSLTLKTMEFEPVVTVGSAPSPGFLTSLGIDMMSIIQLGVLAVVALILGLFVVRPILASQAGVSATQSLAVPGGVSGALPGPSVPTGASGFPDPDTIPELPPLTGELDEGGFGGPGMAVVSDFDFGEMDDGLPAVGGDPVERLRALIEERQSETIEILRGWMEDEEEPA